MSPRSWFLTRLSKCVARSFPCVGGIRSRLVTDLRIHHHGRVVRAVRLLFLRNEKCSIAKRQRTGGCSNCGTTAPRRELPQRKSAAFCGSPIVADKPMRRGSDPERRASRSIRHMVCPPRSPRIKECISSMTMKRRSPKSLGITECFLSSNASSDSGVIWRMPEGCSMSLRFLD